MNEKIQELLDCCGDINFMAPSNDDMAFMGPQEWAKVELTVQLLKDFRKAYEEVKLMEADDKFRSLKNTLKAMETLVEQARELISTHEQGEVKVEPKPEPKPKLKPNLYARISEQQRIFSDIILDKENPVQSFAWFDEDCLIAYVSYEDPKFSWKTTAETRDNIWKDCLEEKLIAKGFGFEGVSVKIVNVGSFKPAKIYKRK
jgi:hypothetical protein